MLFRESEKEVTPDNLVGQSTIFTRLTMRAFSNLASGHPSSIRVTKRDRLRRKANERERRRVRLMRVAYSRLEEISPWDPTKLF